LLREQKTTAADDVMEEIRQKLEELLTEGMVIGVNIEEMNTLMRHLLAHRQRRLVRRISCITLSESVV